jgi:hypothetical protein
MIPLAIAELPLLMFVAGCGLLTLLLLRRSYRYFGRRRTSASSGSSALDLQPRPASKWSGAQRDTLARIERERVDLYDMARDLEGQLNSKIIILDQLIATNERQIERMEQLLQEVEERTGAGAEG